MIQKEIDLKARSRGFHIINDEINLVKGDNDSIYGGMIEAQVNKFPSFG